MSVHPSSIVENGAELGTDVEIGPFCHVGSKVRLGNGVRLLSHVFIEGDTEIGDRTIIRPFTSLGGPPQHLGCKGIDTKLVIGSDNTICEHVTMNRGTKMGGGVTRIGSRSYFMASTHVAHDCQISDDVIFANNATIGGHVVVGERAFLGGFTAVHQNCRVGAYAFTGGGAVVVNDLIPYASAFGNHARLVGLNVIGMKRRGMTRANIQKLRTVYKELFLSEQVFSERIESVKERYGSMKEVARIIEFIEEDSQRPLMPAR